MLEYNIIAKKTFVKKREFLLKISQKFHKNPRIFKKKIYNLYKLHILQMSQKYNACNLIISLENTHLCNVMLISLYFPMRQIVDT